VPKKLQLSLRRGKELPDKGHLKINIDRGTERNAASSSGAVERV